MVSARGSTAKLKLVLGLLLTVFLIGIVLCVPKAYAQTAEPDRTAVAVEQADQDSQEALLAQMLSEYLAPVQEPSSLEEVTPVPDGSSDLESSQKAANVTPEVEGSAQEAQASEDNGAVKSLKAAAEEELIPITTNYKPQTYSVNICKYETGTETFVPGATLSLHRVDFQGKKPGDSVSWTTGTECKHFDLTAGKYKLVEVNAPLGYIKSEPVIFEVPGNNEAPKDMDRCPVPTQTVVMYDAPSTVSVGVQKVDEEGAPLTGAGLEIYMIECETCETLIHSWTSGPGVEMVSGLVPGAAYQLVEASVPAGYEPAATIPFTVNSGGVPISHFDGVVFDGILTMTDIMTPEPQNYYVSKLDGFTSEPVIGASLSLYEYGSTDPLTPAVSTQAAWLVQVDNWVSDGSPHMMSGLKNDTSYFIQEDSVPEGYEQADSVYFAIDSDGVLSVESPGGIEGNTVIMYDYPTSGVPEVLKVDDSGNPLAGAQLEVYYTGQNPLSGGQLADSWTSTTTPHVLQNIEYGESYLLAEINAPAGYNPASVIYFEIDEGGNITGADAYMVGGILNMVDTEIPEDDPDDPDDRDRTASVTTIKIDSETGEGLAGAQLAIYMLDSNGEITGSAIDSWTSTGSVHITKGLETSEDYIVVETSAPAGYEVGSDITFSVTNSGSVLASASDKDDNGNLAMGNTPADEEIPAEGEETDVVTPDEEVAPEGEAATEGDVVAPAQASAVVIPRKIVIPKTGDEANAAAAFILFAGAMTLFLGAGFALRKK